MNGRRTDATGGVQPAPVPARAGGLPLSLRFPLLALGFAALFAGILAGLARLAPLQLGQAAGLAPLHGPLMICGFLGTVIGLERAVALGRLWAFAGPLFTALGGLSLLAGLGALLPGAELMVLGSFVLVVASLMLLRIRPAADMAVMALGAASWLAGNLLWLGGAPVPALIPFWAGFLILTIAGERLELSRLMPPTMLGKRLFVAVAAVLTGAIPLTLVHPMAGELVFAGALIALAAWLARYDVARRTVRGQGLPRFIAVCLLLGYAWLAFAGLFILWAGGIAADAALYDAALHAILVGFVFSMIFGHAPVILPAVVRLDVPYRRLFYLHLLLLHGSLAERVIGDLAGIDLLRALGAYGNAAAIVLFVVATVSSAATARLTRAGRLRPLAAPGAR